MIISPRILLRMRNVLNGSCREIKPYFCSKIVFRKSCRLWVNAENCCRVRQATDGSITRRTRKVQSACRITKARIWTHNIEHLVWLTAKWPVLKLTKQRQGKSLLFYGNNEHASAPNVTLYVHCLSCKILKKSSLPDTHLIVFRGGSFIITTFSSISKILLSTEPWKMKFETYVGSPASTISL